MTALHTVLVADRCCTHPAMGSDLRMWNLLGRGDADMLYFAAEDEPPVSDPRGDFPWRSITRIPVAAHAFSIRRRDRQPETYIARHADTAARLRNALDALRARHGAITIVAHGHRSGLLVAGALGLPCVFEGGDAAGLYFARRAKSLARTSMMRAANSVVWGRVYDRIERWIAERAKVYLITAEADRAHLEKLAPGAPLVRLPNGTALVEQPPVEHLGDGMTVGFYGGMAWEPNRSAAVFLARDVMPLLRAKVPGARIRIAGGPPFQALDACGTTPGVDLVGPMSDPRGFLSQCDVFATPMLQGSGFKNKIIEAMACGMPLVTNELGAEALSPDARAAMLVAEGAGGVANAIAELLGDAQKRATLGAAARAVAERDFRWDALSAEMRRVLERLATEG